ncbi:uncharacterized protein [Spinacia oleracea]|nr:uncharacterized protein LOC110799108 isoform X2 [Spinacia oleracea]XP_056698834.1 uncharacterized protein LOC110799108 isoform X2 [Spinacia oleracea]
MFSEDVPEAVLDVAAHLLLTILNNFPPSVHRHHDNAEDVIVSKIMSANCNANVLKKLSNCLASLPKSKGDEGSWSLMMQKILLTLSDLLNSTLEGLEEETRRVEAVTLLVLPGKDRPLSLGGKVMAGKALNSGERSQKMLISSISSLVQCCCIMLTNYYPVQVTVPVCPLLAIIRRVLMVNGSLPDTLKPFTTAMQQEFVCLQLPVLHLNMLEILAAVIKGLRSQLLPHAAGIMWLLMKFLKTCCIPELRTKAYSIIKDLLISMGAGMTLYISEEVIDNISVDLKFADSNYGGSPLDEPSIVKPSQQSRQKKRKHGASTGPSDEEQASLCSESKDSQSSIALKIAAIETLEALLVMGGALSCDSWRRRMDDLMIEVATNACKGGWTHFEKHFHCMDTRVNWEDFQLVALRALLASILSPAGYRPPYLSKGLSLFLKGKQNSGTKVAEFCSQALVSLEVLIHPRALPLIDTQLPNSNSYSFGRTDYGDPKNKPPQKDGNLSTGHDSLCVVYDYLKDKYKEESPDTEVPAFETLKVVSGDQNYEEPNVVNGLLDIAMPMETDEVSKPANLVSKIESSVMVDVQHHEECNKASVSCDETVVLLISSSPSVKKGIENNVSDAKGISSTTGVDNVANAHLDYNTFKMAMIDEEDELSDSFPDIVDADPDSDSE